MLRLLCQDPLWLLPHQGRNGDTGNSPGLERDWHKLALFHIPTACRESVWNAEPCQGLSGRLSLSQAREFSRCQGIQQVPGNSAGTARVPAPVPGAPAGNNPEADAEFLLSTGSCPCSQHSSLAEGQTAGKGRSSGTGMGSIININELPTAPGFTGEFEG